MPALTPAGNVGSQIERAVIAYLTSVWNGSVVNLPNFYFSNDWKDRVAPLIDVLAIDSTEEQPFTGNEAYQLRIKAEWPGNNQLGVTNPDWNWVQINNFIGLVMAAMCQSDNGSDYKATAALITAAGRTLATAGSVTDQANNADMVNFTCTFVRFKGSKRAVNVAGALYIHEVRNFEIWACPSNVD